MRDVISLTVLETLLAPQNAEPAIMMPDALGVLLMVAWCSAGVMMTCRMTVRGAVTMTACAAVVAVAGMAVSPYQTVADLPVATVAAVLWLHAAASGTPGRRWAAGSTAATGSVLLALVSPQLIIGLAWCAMAGLAVGYLIRSARTLLAQGAADGAL